MHPFTAEEFQARRAKVLDRIGPDACAVLQGAGPVDGFTLFRQTNEFFYLTGLEVPQAYLLLDGKTHTSVLFVPPHDAHAARSEGEDPETSSPAAVRVHTGVDEVLGWENLAPRLKGFAEIYTPLQAAEGWLACQDTLRLEAKAIAADPWDRLPSRETRFSDRLREASGLEEVSDLSPILNELRLIKSPAEIEVLREAGELCAQGVSAAMRIAKAGVYEYELGAMADYVYRKHHAREGYRAIIARGENIWFPHYYRCDGQLQDGELVLMDVAPDVHNYTSDIGRMWPVNGIYSPVQRELYGFMVEYHKVFLEILRPGVLPKQILAEAADRMRPVIDVTHFSKLIYEQAARHTLDFAGHLSHPVGMTVHDVGKYFDQPLTSGLVFALDPQMWIPEEQLYIRVEDTVVITETGVESLTRSAPLELDDVEAFLRESGTINTD